MSVVFRLSWRERSKLVCKTCCTDDKHPWDERRVDYENEATAKRDRDRLYDNDQSRDISDVKLTKEEEVY